MISLPPGADVGAGNLGQLALPRGDAGEVSLWLEITIQRELEISTMESSRQESYLTRAGCTGCCTLATAWPDPQDALSSCKFLTCLFKLSMCLSFFYLPMQENSNPHFFIYVSLIHSLHNLFSWKFFLCLIKSLFLIFLSLSSLHQFKFNLCFCRISLLCSINIYIIHLTRLPCSL